MTFRLLVYRDIRFFLCAACYSAQKTITRSIEFLCNADSLHKWEPAKYASGKTICTFTPSEIIMQYIKTIALTDYHCENLYILLLAYVARTVNCLDKKKKRSDCVI